MKTPSSFRKSGRMVLAAIAFTAFGGGAAFSQTLASAQQPGPAGLPAPSGLTVIAYQVPETTKFKVHFQNPSGERVRIVLKNDRHESVYAEDVTNTKRGYIRKFDMKDMADGTYRFEVSSGQQKVTREIGLQTTLARSVLVQ